MCLVSIKTLYWRMVPPPFLTGYPYNGYRTPPTIWVDDHPYHRKTMVCKLRVFQTHTSHPGTVGCQQKLCSSSWSHHYFFEMFFFVSVRFMIPKHPPTSAKFQPFLSPFFDGQGGTNFTPDWRIIQVKKTGFLISQPSCSLDFWSINSSLLGKWFFLRNLSPKRIFLSVWLVLNPKVKNSSKNKLSWKSLRVHRRI